jgi:hypothetical protein
MRRVFNLDKIVEFFQYLENISLYRMDFHKEDIITKKIWKKLINIIDSIESAKAVFLSINDREKQEEMIKRFFPTKYESLKNDIIENNLSFKTTHFFYHPLDGKIHWGVVQYNSNDEPVNEREFKLKTDLFLDRTVEERKNLKDIIKKKLEKLYGYNYIELGAGKWGITDGNKDKDGNFKLLVFGQGLSILNILKNNSFCDDEFSLSKRIVAP